jgi:outer membrane immunogenic protein
MEQSFKRGVFAAVSTLALALAGSATALAADPVREAPNWTGFYLGVYAGGGAVVNEIESSVLGDLDFNGVGGEGLLGSIMAGYNYQMDNFVLGIQGEAGYNDLGTELEIPGLGGLDLDAEQGFVAAVSARLGLLVTPETLAYIIGGYSYSEYETDISGLGSFDENFDGFHIGGGLETMIGSNATVRVEYRYTGYSSEDWDTDGAVDVSPSTHTGTVGLAWLF